ncbi:hypothetical protein F4677DRAFT_428766 [Hypoxylon crocopeplum]|nr:hypothetical protein F4677DRAFT_428766 [Hypoxylon crocopeplum]
MFCSIVAATALLINTVVATPPTSRSTCNSIQNAPLTFQGDAMDATYDICVPVDGRVYGLNSAMSVSHVTSYASDSIHCAVAGVAGLDHGLTIIHGHETVAVEPHRPQSRVVCLANGNSTLRQSLRSRYEMKSFRLS